MVPPWKYSQTYQSTLNTNFGRNGALLIRDAAAPTWSRDTTSPFKYTLTLHFTLAWWRVHQWIIDLKAFNQQHSSDQGYQKRGGRSWGYIYPLPNNLTLSSPIISKYIPHICTIHFSKKRDKKAITYKFGQLAGKRQFRHKKRPFQFVHIDIRQIYLSNLLLPDVVSPATWDTHCPKCPGEIKSRQTGTLKCSKFFISLERFGLGRPLTTNYEGLIEANRLTFNLIQLNNTTIY